MHKIYIVYILDEEGEIVKAWCYTRQDNAKEHLEKLLSLGFKAEHRKIEFE